MIKKIIFLLIFLFSISSSLTFAQLNNNYMSETHTDKASLAIGGGFDYGGFGLNGLYYPTKNLGFFAGAGYAIVDFGYNIGIKLRFVNEETFKKANAYFTAMYGYHTAIAVSNATQYNKLFYGATVGVGFDYKSRPDKSGYWTFGLMVPIRGGEVDNYIEDLKDNHGVEFNNDLLPIGLSIGYRFIIN